MNVKSKDELNWRKQFGDRLKRLIHISGKSQRQVANELGIDEAKLSKYITGTHTPNAYRIQQLADVIGCDVNQLYDKTF